MWFEIVGEVERCKCLRVVPEFVRSDCPYVNPFKSNTERRRLSRVFEL
jgi:hypothetical protein